MRKGHLVRGFFAVNGQVGNTHLKAERDDVEATELNAAAGNAFQFADQTVTRHGLERSSGGIPGSGAQQDETPCQRKQQDFPYVPPTRLRAGFGHRKSSPAPSVSASVLMLLPERRLCSHATINSLTFC